MYVCIYIHMCSTVPAAVARVQRAGVARRCEARARMRRGRRDATPAPRDPMQIVAPVSAVGIHIRIYTYIYIYICMYLNMYIHIYTYT